MAADPPPAADAARLRTWQGATAGTLFVGYAGHYVCRSVLPVVSNQLIDDPSVGIDAHGYGRLGAVGIYCYAAGKLLNGVSAEVKHYGFAPLLDVLLGLAAATLVVSLAYWWAEERRFRTT